MDPRKYQSLRVDLDNYWEKLSRKKFTPPKVTLKKSKYDLLELPSYAKYAIGDEYTLIKSPHGCVCDNKSCFDMYYIADDLEHTTKYTSIPMYTNKKNHEICILCVL